MEERAAEPAEEHDCPAFTDYRRMLDEVERDALYVCVPPFANEDAELRAAEWGIHLSVEKSGHGGGEWCGHSRAIRQAGILSSVGYSLRNRRPLGGGEVKIVPEGADGPVELPGEVVDIDASFVAAVRSGDGSSILCDYEEGLKSAAVSIAANESAINGNPVRCWT